MSDPARSHSEAQARASAWLAAWDQLGIHRTATVGGRAGAAWLAREAAAFGVEVTIEEFARIRCDARHRALVVLCTGDRPGLGLLNAERFRNPYGAPAVHVSSIDRPAVFEAIAQRRPARLVSTSRRTPTHAFNVVVTLRGAKHDGRPLVVMTPHSSWWQSTAERGGGIVCWLESLRALIAAPPRCDVVFTANSGHELGHLGLDDFVARRPGRDRPEDKGGACWVHYG